MSRLIKNKPSYCKVTSLVGFLTWVDNINLDTVLLHPLSDSLNSLLSKLCELLGLMLNVTFNPHWIVAAVEVVVVQELNEIVDSL